MEGYVLGASGEDGQAGIRLQLTAPSRRYACGRTILTVWNRPTYLAQGSTSPEQAEEDWRRVGWVGYLVPASWNTSDDANVVSREFTSRTSLPLHAKLRVPAFAQEASVHGP